MSLLPVLWAYEVLAIVLPLFWKRDQAALKTAIANIFWRSFFYAALLGTDMLFLIHGTQTS